VNICKENSWKTFSRSESIGSNAPRHQEPMAVKNVAFETFADSALGIRGCCSSTTGARSEQEDGHLVQRSRGNAGPRLGCGLLDGHCGVGAAFAALTLLPRSLARLDTYRPSEFVREFVCIDSAILNSGRCNSGSCLLTAVVESATEFRKNWTITPAEEIKDMEQLHSRLTQLLPWVCLFLLSRICRCLPVFAAMRTSSGFALLKPHSLCRWSLRPWKNPTRSWDPRRSPMSAQLQLPTL